MATKRAVRPKTAIPKVEDRPRTVSYIGNFRAEHSTENHIARALRFHGHIVNQIQEDAPGVWHSLSEPGVHDASDFILWTRTGWDYVHPNHGAYSSPQEVLDLQTDFLNRSQDRGVPVIGYHLDLWHGLNREEQVYEPFFDCDVVVTADGGSDQWFAAREVNHVWFPPGVSLPECELGMWRDQYASPLVFVGSWEGHYHRESEHRFRLVDWLQREYGERVAFYPQSGFPGVRGQELRDLYASVDIAIGDSCLVGSGRTKYVSDRVPETTGRGALLFHPMVDGVLDGTPWAYGPTWKGGEHLVTWTAGDWDGLAGLIDHYLGADGERAEIARVGREHTRLHHTYERRVDQLVQLLIDRKLITE